MREFLINFLYAILGAMVGVVVLVLIWYILQVIAYWKLFKKAGQPGWKSLIPFYNQYMQYKICWRPVMFWIFTLLSVGANVLYTTGLDNENDILIVIGAVLMVCGIVIGIMGTYKLARAFGHGGGYTVGLLLLRPIFMLILGFGSSKYARPQK